MNKDELQERNELLMRAAEGLWDLLDDIDSGGDIFKPDCQASYTAFYKYVMRLAKYRHQYLVSDGYELGLVRKVAKTFKMEGDDGSKACFKVEGGL